MLGNHSATLAVLLTLGAATLAHAQQSAGDSTHSQRARARDERAVTTDTIRLHRDIAIRDSARAALDQDRRQQQADEHQLDSLQAVLTRDRKAKPRDTAAVKRDLAVVTGQRQKLDGDRDRAHREQVRWDADDKRVRKESEAAIEAHHDIREDRPKAHAPAIPVKPDTAHR